MILLLNFSNTSSQEHSVFFSQHFSYPMPLLRTTPLVQLLLHIDTSPHLSPILYYSAHFSALPTLYTPRSFCVHTISQPPSAATCDPRSLKQSTSSNGSPFSLARNRPPFSYAFYKWNNNWKCHIISEWNRTMTNLPTVPKRGQHEELTCPQFLNVAIMRNWHAHSS